LNRILVLGLGFVEEDVVETSTKRPVAKPDRTTQVKNAKTSAFISAQAPVAILEPLLALSQYNTIQNSDNSWHLGSSGLF
jgi:hypothetical protein